jgi:hypothetical protein
MYVQAKKDLDQQWLPTQYRLTEDEMGHIMVDWDDEWKIPPAEVGPSEKQNPKYMRSMMMKKKETHIEKGNGTKRKTQQTTSCIERKRKEPETGRLCHNGQSKGHQRSGYPIFDRGIFGEDRRSSERSNR